MLETVMPVLITLKDVLMPVLIMHGPEIVVAITTLIYARDWKKLRDFAEEKSLEVAEEALSNEEKRETVTNAVYKALPKKFKVFPFNVFINETTIRKVVNHVYVTQVKPQRDLEGKNVSVQHLAQEVECLRHEVCKAPQPRDAKGRFKKAEEN